MLDTFRKASKTWVVKLLFALLVLSFLAWGVGDVLRNGLFGHGAAIEVGGTHKTANEVYAEFKREVDRLQPMFGGKLTQEDARKLGLMDRTIENIVTRTLIEEAGSRLGLALSDEAVVSKIAADPNFRNERGEFDRDLMQRLLARNGLSETAFLRAEKGNMLRAQMAESLSAGVTAPETLLNPLVRWREEKRVADMVVIRDDALPAPAAPTPDQLAAYYKDNSQRFMAPEFRTLTVLLARPADVAAQIEITPDMINESYQSRLEEFQVPERRQVTQVVLPDQAKADKAAELLKSGKDIAAIAKETGTSTVDLGMVARGELPDELADPVFKAPEGTTLPPVHSALGWHLVQIGKIAPGQTRTVEQVKDQLDADLRHEQALDKLSDLGNQIEDALGGGATLEEVADRFKLRLVKVPAVDSQGLTPAGKPAADLPKGENFLDVAFHTDQGTESQLTEAENEGYFLVRVDGVTAPQPKPLPDVRDQVIAAWQAEKRHAAGQEQAAKAIEQLKAGKSATEVTQSLPGAKAQASQPFTREGAEAAGLPPQLVSEMFKAEIGGTASSATQGGWIAARLAKVVPFDPAQAPQIMDLARQRTSQAIAGDLVDEYLAALTAEIGVMVDRSQLSREE